MFQFPAFASFIRKIPESLPVGCPIRRSTDHGVFASPRSFSQLVTSFFASESLGIPHAPFFASLCEELLRFLSALHSCFCLDLMTSVCLFGLRLRDRSLCLLVVIIHSAY